MPEDEEVYEEEDDLRDVRNPDHDLSEWGIAYDRGPDRQPWFARPWVQVVLALLIITSLVLPFVLRI